MSWIIAIALALAVQALALFVLGAPRHLWAPLAACLALGLAGYSFQASPELPGAPATPPGMEEEQGWALVDARKELVDPAKRSRNDKLVFADAMTRRGQHQNAAAITKSAANDDPDDAEAWLALGNALVEHAGGRLTKPAMLAYRRSAATDPESVAPGYFLGLALIRQGNLIQGRNVWQEVVEKAPEGVFARDVVAERLARLDALLMQIEASSTGERE
jgi:cytochrome c-type biogenesis protein CcmH